MQSESSVSSRSPQIVTANNGRNFHLQDAFQEHATLQLFVRVGDGDVTASLTQEEVMSMLSLNTDKNFFTPIDC